MDGNLDLLQRIEQQLQSVGQCDGAGGVGQEEGAGDEQHDAQDHFHGARDALPCDYPARDYRRALRVENVQRGGQHDDEQHRLQPLEYRRRFYLRQRHARSRRQHHRDVRHPAVRLEQRDDVQHDKYQLRARVQPVDYSVSWEVLAEGDVLQHMSTPFSSSSAAFSCS